ncbi:MAG: hypothetical protein B6245_20650 [Desulfobacteraceae bacterium 4572_88]|nr:MAG: hypothetical protein B6245_20650 [Desulfobacteraceae bacterium 4572_88]
MFMNKFSEKLAEGLAGQWAAQTLGPAFVFWAGGVMAWTYQNGWNALESKLRAFTSTPACIDPGNMRGFFCLPYPAW